MKFGIRGQLTDVITCVKYLVDWFRGYGVLTPKIAISHRLAASPLQQCTYCRATLWCHTVLGFTAATDDGGSGADKWN